MNNDRHRDNFDFDELEDVNSENCVVLASGGPLMTIVTTEELPDGTEQVLCSWHDGEKTVRGLFKSGMLRRLRPYRSV